jgi:hypothetical protein
MLPILNPWRPAIFDHPLPRRVFPGRTSWKLTMRKLLTLWIALAAVTLAALLVSASAQDQRSLLLLLNGPVAAGGGGGGGFSITLADKKPDTAGGSPITYNSGGNPSIGASNSNRVIVIEILARTGNALGATGVTVNGNAATQAPSAASLSNSMSTDIWYITEAAAGTTGLTTAPVVVTYSAASIRSEIAVYRIIPTTPTPTSAVNNKATSVTTLTSPGITIPSGGGLIACAAFRNTGAATWTGFSNDFDDQIAATNEATGMKSTTAGSSGYTITFAGSAQDIEMSVAAWGP